MEMEARSQNHDGKMVAHGVRLAIVAIQAVPAVEGELTYLAMLKKAIEQEMMSVKDRYKEGVAAALGGLAMVLALVEEQAAQADIAPRQRPRQAMPGEAPHLSLETEADIQLWCANLNCSEAQLVEAVSQVGTSVERVKAYLKDKTRTG
jgi:hypothetical protein